MLESTLHRSPARVRAADYVRLIVEFEIAVHIAEDLPAADRPFSRARVAEAVGAVMPALELADDRDADYKELARHPLELIADNCWNEGRGARRPGDRMAPPRPRGRARRRLPSTAARWEKGGAPTRWAIRSTRSLGSPTTSPPTAAACCATNLSLPAASSPPRPSAPGDVVRFEVSELGPVELRVQDSATA